MNGIPQWINGVQLVRCMQELKPEPIFEGHADDVTLGSFCVGVAYTSREAERESGEIKGFGRFTSSIVDGMGIANALVIRIQTLILPIRALVFSD